MSPTALTAALLLAAGLALHGAPARAATEAQSPQGLLKGKLPDEAQVLRKVAIGNFVVQYVTGFGVEDKRSHNTSFTRWLDAPPELLQAGAEALYTQLVAELKAGGIAVVDPAQVAAQPALEALRQVARKSPAVVQDGSVRRTSTLVAAQGLPLLLLTVPDAPVSGPAPEPMKGTYANNLVGWEQQARTWLSMGNVEAMSAGSIYPAQQKLAEALSATVLSLRVTVALFDVGLERKVGGFGVGLFSGGDHATAQANPRLAEGGTVVMLATPGGNPGHQAQQLLGLQKPVPVSGLKAATEPLAKSSEGGLLGALKGALGADNDQADFALKVEPDGFAPALAAAGATVFKELAQTLAGAGR